MLVSEILKQVRRIQVRTGRQVADVLAGEYVSVFKGRGMEFDEVRPYVPGDDVRTIDWNVTARSGAPYVKRFVEERELTVMLLVDVSPSMGFGSAARSKREAATELSALIAFSAIRNDDKVGLLLFHGGTERYIPPRKGQKHAMRVVREVLARGEEEGVAGAGAGAGGGEGGRGRGGSSDEGAGSGGAGRGARGLGRVLARVPKLLERFGFGRRAAGRATDVGAAVEHARRAIRRRAVVFVVSDFLDEGFLRPLRTANRRHDVVCVLVGDRREAEPADAGGLLTLMDAETGALRAVDTGDAGWREAAARAARERVERLRAELRSSGVDLVEVDAAGSVVEPLVSFFHMRQRRFRR
jgi:uncharacterized protein (DUF58 family)